MGCAALEGGDGIDDRLRRLLAEHAAAGTPCVLATVVRCEPPTSAHPGDAAVIDASGGIHGWIGGSCSEPLVRREALRALEDGLPRLVRIAPSETADEHAAAGEVTVGTTCPSGGALEVFVDPQLPRPTLIVAGGGPAARALAVMGGAAGFRTCVVHPGAKPPDFPGADQVIPSFDVAAANPGRDTWAIVATMGHHDEDALEALLAHGEVDVALVASVRRARAVMEVLRGRGVSDQVLARVRSPAGGERAGRQEEIAVLALAEVVGLRQRRRDASRSAAPSTSAGAEGFGTDPVCGMVVDVTTSQHLAVHEGVTVHFCGAGCRDAFVRDPGAFSTAPRA